MSKTWRNILIIVAVIALLGGALTFLLLSGDPQEDTEDPDSTGDSAVSEEVTLVDIQADGDTAASPIRTAEISSAAFDTFTVVQAEDGSLVVDGFQGITPATSLFESLEAALTSITAVKKVTETDTPADFGFDKPQAAFKVTYENGESHAFEFGNEEPYGTGDYFRFADSSTVYLVDTTLLDTVALNPNAYISTVLYSSPALPETAANETATAVLRDFDLSGEFYGEEELAMRFVTSEDSSDFLYTNYLITKPFVRSSNSDKLGESLVTATSLTADLAVVPRYTQKDLETYGLKDPYVKAKLHTAVQIVTTNEDDETVEAYKNVEEHTVSLSKPDENGKLYVIVDDNPSLFQITGSNIAWLGLTYSDSVLPLLFLKNIDSVSEMIYTVNGETYDFKLTHYPEEEETEDQLKVTLDGKVMDTENFRNLYQVAMGLSRSGETDETPSGTPEVRLQLIGNDNTKMDIKIYNASASVYLVENGDEVYKVTASRVRNLISQLEHYLAGEEVNTNV